MRSLKINFDEYGVRPYIRPPPTADFRQRDDFISADQELAFGHNAACLRQHLLSPTLDDASRYILDRCQRFARITRLPARAEWWKARRLLIVQYGRDQAQDCRTLNRVVHANGLNDGSFDTPATTQHENGT
jgi:hypothetical protein